MDATDKLVERLGDWFRNHSQDDGVRVYDDEGCSIGVDGRVDLVKLAGFILHGNATKTPGPPPELANNDVQARDGEVTDVLEVRAI